jgi:hypothetical protein
MSSTGLNSEPSTGTVVRAARLLEMFTPEHPELSLSALTLVSPAVAAATAVRGAFTAPADLS